jgi:hypothetical protein
MDVYIDESGDLGFGQNASDFFVLAAIITKDSSAIDKCIKRIRMNRLSKKYKQTSELKFNNSNDAIKRRILECIAKTDSNLAYIILHKRKSSLTINDSAQHIHDHMFKKLLFEIIINCNLNGTVNVCPDKSMYTIDEDVLGQKLDRCSLKLEPLDSRQYPCIQAADFIAGTITQKYRGDSIHYQKIESCFAVTIDYIFENK